MSRSNVDEHVVRMVFDNEKFEKGISKTRESVSNLKKNLNFDDTSKSIANLSSTANNVDFSKMASSLSFLEKRFSTMGIVGMRVIENLTDGVMNLLSKTLNQIKTGGITRAMNLENAQFQLEGLLQDSNKVDAIMKNVGDAVDGTAYSLDAAAKVASQIAASGLEGGELMFKTLRGIAGVAAMTNSTYEEIGDIFTRVNGQGRVMANDLNSMASRGLNAAAILAKQFNTTELEIREMVRQGKISFEIFANAMDDAFGEHAKAANKTVTGALSNIRSALSRIGALFVTPLIKKDGPLVQFLNQIRLKINDVKNAMVPLADVVTNFINNTLTKFTDILKGTDITKWTNQLTGTSDKWSTISKQIESAGIKVDDFKTVLIETAKENGIAIDAMIAKEGSFEATLKTGWLTVDLFKKAIDNFTKKFKTVTKPVEDATNRLKEFDEIVNRVIRGDFSAGAERIEQLTQAGYDYATVQDLVNKKLEKGTLTLEDLNTEELKTLGYTDEQIAKLQELAKEADKANTPIRELFVEITKPTALQLVASSVKNLVEGVKQLALIGKNAFSTIFNNRDASTFYSIVEKIEATTRKLTKFFKNSGADQAANDFDNLTESGKMVSHIFEGVFAAFHAVGEVLGQVIAGSITFVNSMPEVGRMFLKLGEAFGLVSKKADKLATDNKYIIKVFDLLSATVGRLINFLAKGVNGLINFLHELSRIPIVREFAHMISDQLNKGLENAVKYFDDAAKGSDTLLGKLVALIKTLDFKTFTKNAKEFLNTIHLSDITNIFSTLGDVAKGVWENIKSIFKRPEIPDGASLWSAGLEKVKDGFNAVKESIKGFVDIVGSQAVTNVLLGVGIVATWKSLGIIGTSVAHVATVAAEVVSSFKTTLFEFNKTLKTFKVALITWSFKQIAASVIMVTVAIAALALMIKLDGPAVFGGLAVFGAIVGILAALAWSISKLQIGKNLNANALALAGLVVTITLLMLALIPLSKIPLDMGLVVKIGLVALTIVGLVGVFKLMEVLKIQNAVGSAAGVLLLAVSLLTVVKAIEKLSQADFRQMTSALALMIPLLISLKLISSAMGTIDPLKSLGVILLCAALKLLVWTLKSVANDAQSLDAIAAGLIKFIPLIAVITMITWALSQAGAPAVKASLAAIAISAALLVMTLAIKLLAGVTPEVCTRAAITLGFLGFVLAAVLDYSKGMQGVNALAIQKLAFLFAALVAGVIILGLFPAERVLVGTVAMSAVLLALGQCVKNMSALAKDAGDTTQLRNVVLIIGVLGIVMAALIALASMDFKNTLSAGVAISAVLLAFAGAVKILASTTFDKKQVNSAHNAAEGIAVLAVSLVVPLGMIATLSMLMAGKEQIMLTSTAALTAVLIAFTGMIAVLSKIDMHYKKNMTSMRNICKSIALLAASLSVAIFEIALFAAAIQGKEQAVITATASMAVILGSLTLCMDILNRTNIKGNEIKTAEAMLLASLAIIPIAGALVALTKYGNMDHVVEATLSMVGLLAAVAACSAAVSKFGPEILKGAVLLDGVALIVGGFFALIAQIDEWTNGWVSDKLVRGAQMVGEAIGALLGGVAGGVIKSIGSSLPSVGKNISDFATNATPFFNVMSKMSDDEKLTDGITKIISAIKMLADAKLTDGLSGIFGSSYTQLGKDLTEFAKNIKTFYDEVHKTDMDLDELKKMGEAFKVVAEMAATMPKFGGLQQGVFGVTDLAQMGKQLSDFAPYLKDFAEKTKGLDADVVNNAASCATVLAEFAEKSPKFNGLAQMITGSIDLENLGWQLTSFGEQMMEFADVTRGLDKAVVDNAANAAKSLIEFAKIAPSYGGLVTIFTGQQSLAVFGLDLLAFGIQFKDYAEQMQYIDPDVVTKSSAAAKSVMAFELPAKSGFLNSTYGLADFAQELCVFGQGFRLYHDSVDGIDLDNIYHSALGIERITTALKYVHDAGDLNRIGPFMEGLMMFGNDLSDFTQISYGLSQDAAEAVAGMINKIVEAVKTSDSVSTKHLADLINTLGESGIKAVTTFSDSFTDAKWKVQNAVQTMLTYATDAINTNGTKAKDAMQEVVKRMLDTLNYNASSANTAVTKMMGGLVSIIDSYRYQFERSGAYVGKGLIAGLEGESYGLSEAGRRMGESLLKQMKDTLGIHSPSKEAMTIGSYFGEGFVIGLDDWSRNIANKANDLGNGAVSALNESIKNTVAIFDSGIDFNPVIKPRLDLSDVVAGTKSLSNMLENPLIKARTSTIQNDGTIPANAGATYNFYQTNNSPKALTSTDIYRQTKNQISLFRRAVEA